MMQILHMYFILMERRQTVKKFTIGVRGKPPPPKSGGKRGDGEKSEAECGFFLTEKQGFKKTSKNCQI
ncbi:MAG: hypothetical protein MR374_05100 [Clostridia bacterium]|nr:hypothetical protein [Clostridia bacterium]MDY5559460.1 hypothetical protein [Candidatus Heritagella sp.]